MAFYPQFPAFYAYPMPYPSQDFYAMYPPGSNPGPAVEGGPPAPTNGPIYYDGVAPSQHKSSFGHGPMAGKHGFNNRKDSADSGISDFSNYSSRKSSSTSTTSTSHGIHEESLLDDVKEEEPYEEPDDDLCEKIVAQVEFYFGDANITKDKFLLKHVKRNKEGFVSLKLISSFKRVKHLTKDWRQVAEAIERKSSKLEVNDLKTKVRRLDPLPEYDETTPSRTVVALNLPLERPTIEAVAEIFSTCGEIVLVRILRPGNPIPADIKPFANKHPEMTAKVCALVEFERTEFALKSVADLNKEEDGEGGMKVMELTAPPPKTNKNKDDKGKKSFTLIKQHQPSYTVGQAPQPNRRFSHAGFGQQQMQMHHQNGLQHQAAIQDMGPRRRISLNHNMKFTAIAEEPGQRKGSEIGLNPNAPTFTMHQQAQRRISRPNQYMPPNPMMDMMTPAQAAHAAHAAAAHAAAAAAAAYQHPMGPPVQMVRRISGNGTAASGLALPPNVLRLPRGPEKNSKGFQRWCKTRMQQAEAPMVSAPQPQPQPLRRPGSRAVPIVAPPPEDKKDEKKAEAAANVDDKMETQEEKAVKAAVEEVVAAVPVPGQAPPPPADPAPLLVPAADDSLSESDSGNEDEGHFSEPEAQEGANAPQPSFAANLSIGQEDEKSR